MPYGLSSKALSSLSGRRPHAASCSPSSRGRSARPGSHRNAGVKGHVSVLAGFRGWVSPTTQGAHRPVCLWVSKGPARSPPVSSLSECLGDPDVALWGTGPRCVSRRNMSALYLRALTCSRGCHSVTTPLAWGFGKNACDLTSGIPR